MVVYYKKASPFGGAFFRRGGRTNVHVTPSLNPSPRGRDPASEDAARLQARSLRSETLCLYNLSL